MKQLLLKSGHIALVDDEDYDRVKDFPWRIQPKKGYVFATVYLHRLIMKVSGKITVDHHNENKLDNQKVNLNVMSLQDNIRKRSKRPNGGNRERKTIVSKPKSSKFTGVILRKGKWNATLAGKHLGTFISEIEAAKAYNVAAIQRYGNTAWINRL